jgi:hypothetical protein
MHKEGTCRGIYKFTETTLNEALKYSYDSENTGKTKPDVAFSILINDFCGKTAFVSGFS